MSKLKQFEWNVTGLIGYLRFLYIFNIFGSMILTELWPLSENVFFVVSFTCALTSSISWVILTFCTLQKNTQTSIQSSYISNKLSNHLSIQLLNWILSGNTYDCFCYIYKTLAQVETRVLWQALTLINW